LEGVERKRIYVIVYLKKGEEKFFHITGMLNLFGFRRGL
jgi:hypothetical protein